MEYPFKCPFKRTLADIDAYRMTQAFAELRRKVQELDEARGKKHVV